MNIKRLFFFAAIALLAISSCKKSSDPTLKGVTDVYAFGLMATTNAQSQWVQTYWKNGEPHQANKIGDGFFFSQSPNAIAVSGDDVYIAGQSNSGLTNNLIITAVYWKNGIPVSLPSGPGGVADAIAVNGADVYACGNCTNNTSGFSNAVYWKNGNLVRLNDDLVNSFAEGIAISGNDVYVIGHMFTSKGEYVGVVWKNGVATALSNAVYSSITISGSNVYIAGSVRTPNGGPAYWKNGVAYTLPYNSLYPEQTVIAGTKSDIYISGFVDIKSPPYGYWKNGVGYGVSSTPLTSIALDGTDIYYLAHRMDSQYSTPYFIVKNGVELSLTSDMPHAYVLYGIGVVRH